MTAPAELLSANDIQQVQDLIVEHAWLLDHERWHEVAELYAEEGTLTLGGHTLTGRAQFLAWADHRAANAARRTHHQCTNIRLRADGDAATGTVMLVLHVSNGGAPYIEFVGEYRDIYQRNSDGQWRFRSRQLHPLSPPDDSDTTAKGVDDA